MANAILGLLTETPLHAGAGASAGVIDLPIQREAHTRWPCVVGSGVKGALRAAAAELGDRADWIAEVFGPAPGNGTDKASDHAGALAIGDARLLLMPVRSLTTHFRWVTCPALLRRAQADCRRLGIAGDCAPDELAPTDGEVLVAVQQVPEARDQLFLEDFSFEQAPRDLSQVIAFLARFMAVEKADALLSKQLAIVSDDIFAHLSQFATPVAAHIAIDNRTKTVKSGALWYEETLPPETVLYTCLMAYKSRRDGSAKSARQVLRHATADLFESRPYLQLGGNETVGMGWCKVAVLEVNGEGGE